MPLFLWKTGASILFLYFEYKYTNRTNILLAHGSISAFDTKFLVRLWRIVGT